MKENDIGETKKEMGQNIEQQQSAGRMPRLIHQPWYATQTNVCTTNSVSQLCSRGGYGGRHVDHWRYSHALLHLLGSGVWIGQARGAPQFEAALFVTRARGSSGGECL